MACSGVTHSPPFPPATIEAIEAIEEEAKDGEGKHGPHHQTSLLQHLGQRIGAQSNIKASFRLHSVCEQSIVVTVCEQRFCTLVFTPETVLRTNRPPGVQYKVCGDHSETFVAHIKKMEL